MSLSGMDILELRTNSIIGSIKVLSTSTSQMGISLYVFDQYIDRKQ
ncbi:MAG: hypothetical protein ACI9DG_001396 [Oleispira sp.]|jgi:hypothetical protein